MPKDVLRFLDDSGKVFAWPKKHADKQLVLEYMVGKFEHEKPYTEKEVNEIVNQWHTFQDWPLLRRGMIDAGLLTRDIEGHEYLRPRQ
jgi:hypothetical protein